jgi:hypothetical protein
MKKVEPLVVYWAPYWTADKNYSILFEEPTNLYKELAANKEPRSKRISLFNCPAVNGRMKNTFVFRNTVDTKIEYDFTNPDNPLIRSLYGHQAINTKPSSFVNGAYFTIQTMWIFFCEEPLEALISPPMMHKPTKFSNKGFFPPGKMDIGQWFRPVTSEIQLWDSAGELEIKDQDPLFYLELLTDRPVVLKRFVMDHELVEVMNSCVRSTDLFGKGMPLIDKYKKFIKSKSDKKTINAIKKNLVDKEE